MSDSALGWLLSKSGVEWSGVKLFALNILFAYRKCRIKDKHFIPLGSILLRMYYKYITQVC
jgi:hypothetical protein